MHEMGIVFELFDTLRGVIEENGINKLHKVRVEVGEASMVVPRFLLDCWDAARPGTEFEDTELVIDEVVAHGRCLSCGTVFEIRKSEKICPNCKDFDHFVTVDGTSMEIVEVEAE